MHLIGWHSPIRAICQLYLAQPLAEVDFRILIVRQPFTMLVTRLVDLNTHFKMADQANVILLLMKTRRALAVPQITGAETVMLTANVLDALTSGHLVMKP